jgi:hypothetical protein
MTEHVIYSMEGIHRRLEQLVAIKESVILLTIPAAAVLDKSLRSKFQQLDNIQELTIQHGDGIPPFRTFPSIILYFPKLESLTVRHPILEVLKISSAPNLKYLIFTLDASADFKAAAKNTRTTYIKKKINTIIYVPSRIVELFKLEFPKVSRYLHVEATPEEENVGMAGVGAPPVQEEKDEGPLQEEKDEEPIQEKKDDTRIPIIPPESKTVILDKSKIMNVKPMVESTTVAGIIQYNVKNKIVIINEVLSNIPELIEHIAEVLGSRTINALIILESVSRFMPFRRHLDIRILQLHNESNHSNVDLLLPYTERIYDSILIPRLGIKTPCKQLKIQLKHSNPIDIAKLPFFEKLECTNVEPSILKLYKQRHPLSHVVGIDEVIYERPRIIPQYTDVVDNVHIYDKHVIIYDQGITYQDGNAVLHKLIKQLDITTRSLTICGYVYTELPNLAELTSLEYIILVNTAIINFSGLNIKQSVNVFIHNDLMEFPPDIFTYNKGIIVPRMVYKGADYFGISTSTNSYAEIREKNYVLVNRLDGLQLSIYGEDAMQYVINHPFYPNIDIYLLVLTKNANKYLKPLNNIKVVEFDQCQSIDNLELITGLKKISLHRITNPITSFKGIMGVPHVSMFEVKFAINFPLDFEPDILVIDLCDIPNIEEYKQYAIENYGEMAFKLDSEVVTKQLCHADFEQINNEYRQNAMRPVQQPPISYDRIDMQYPTPDDNILPFTLDIMNIGILNRFINKSIKLVSGPVQDAGGLTEQFMTHLTTQLNAFANQGQEALAPLNIQKMPPSPSISSSVHDLLPVLDKIQVLKRNCSMVLYMLYKYNRRDYIPNITLADLVMNIPDFVDTISPVYYQYIARIVLNIPFKHVRHILKTPNGKKNILILYSNILNDTTGQIYETFKNDYKETKGQMYFGRSGVMKGGKVNKTLRARRRRNRTMKGGASSSDDNYVEIIEYYTNYKGIFNIPMLYYMFIKEITRLRGKLDGMQLYYLLNPVVREINAEDIELLLANLEFSTHATQSIPDSIKQFFINIIRDYKSYITDEELRNKYESQHEFLSKLLFYWSSNRQVNRAYISEGKKYRIYIIYPRVDMDDPQYPKHLFKAATCFSEISVIVPTFNRLFHQESGINEIFKALTIMIDVETMNMA